METRLMELETEEKSLLAELGKYAQFDPETLQKVKDETSTAVKAANRWTGRLVFVLQKFVNIDL
jgi:DNA-directed RNA polymerase subunit F